MHGFELTYKGVVYPWHCDHMGHMNVMWYVGKIDEATWALFARIGLTPSMLRTEGAGMAALEQNITYIRESIAGDVLEIKSHILEIRSKTVKFEHIMLDVETGETVATTQIVAVHLDTVARKGIALPQFVRDIAQEITG